MRNLEGKLADYNLAADKLRANTRPEDIRAIYEHIKAQNSKQIVNLDAICMERMTQEEQINSFEAQLNEINQVTIFCFQILFLLRLASGDENQ